MHNIFADFCCRLSRTANQSQRPSSAQVMKIPHQTSYSEHSFFRKTNKSISGKSEGRNIRIKLSHRDQPDSEVRKTINSAINLGESTTKKKEFKYQVINHHCIKKLAVETPNINLSEYGLRKFRIG